MHHSLKQKIEKRIGKVTSVQLLAEQGSTSEVYRLETEKGIYILKSAFEDKYRDWLSAEATILEGMKTESPISMPEFQYYIQQETSSHLLMSFEHGVTLTTALKHAKSRTEQKYLLKKFGEYLNGFHQQVPIDRLKRKNDWLEERLVVAQDYVRAGVTDGNQLLLNQLKSNIPILVKQTMIHGDCTPDNVMVRNGEVALFIDVAGMTVGDPRYDISLAIRKFKEDQDMLNAFYEGYTRYRLSEEEFHYFNQLYVFF